MKRQGRNLNKMYWECIHNRSIKCRGRVKSVGNKLFVTNGWFCTQTNDNQMNEIKINCIFVTVDHNHEHDVDRLEAAHKSGCLVYKSLTSLIAMKSDKNETLEQAVSPVRGIELSDLIVLNKCEGVMCE